MKNEWITTTFLLLIFSSFFCFSKAHAADIIADGGFESASIILTSQVPVPTSLNVWSGTNKGSTTPPTIVSSPVYNGTHAVRIDTTSSDNATYIYQDIVDFTTSFTWRFSVYREGGINSIKLATNWDHVSQNCYPVSWLSFTDNNTLFHAWNTVNRLPLPFVLTKDVWHQVVIQANGSNRSQTLFIDGELITTIVATNQILPPTTAIIGNVAEVGAHGAYVYDDFSLSNNKSLKISASPKSGSPPVNVCFTCNAKDTDGSIVRYRWDFGDGEGNTTTTGKTCHTYIGMDTFYANVTAVDNENDNATSSSIPVVVNYEPDLIGNCEQYIFDSTNNTISVKFRVSNVGKSPTASFNVSCYLSNNGVTPAPVPFKVLTSQDGLKADTSTLMTIDKKFFKSIYGKSVLIYVDSEKEVIERDETNNGTRIVIQDMVTN